MIFRWSTSVAFVVTAAIVAAVPLMSQGQETKARPGVGATWTVPRTSDGHPDLQGVWVNYDDTPFENPSGARRARRGNDGGGVGFYSEDWTVLTRPAASARTAMVVDPSDGIVPLRPEAEQQRDHDVARMGDSWVYQNGWERCITRGVPGGMFPAAYNAAYQIIQGPGHVALIYEMIHEARIIPVDGSAHLPATVRHWNGDSRGRWEGDTLVVEVTNYNGKANIATTALSGRIRNVDQGDQARVVERFTRVSADRINYEVTIEDPQVYTRPWKVAMPLTRDDTYQIYEYACHEGNHAMVDILRGGR